MNSRPLPDPPSSLSLLLGAGEGRIHVCEYVVATSIFLVTPSFGKETSSKGMKIRDKHLLVSRCTECSFPQKSTRLPPSLLQVPAQRSLHHDPLHHPRGIQSPLTCHSLPPLLVDCLSTHGALWNVSPRSTRFGSVVFSLVFQCLAQKALKEYLQNT